MFADAGGGRSAHAAAGCGCCWCCVNDDECAALTKTPAAASTLHISCGMRWLDTDASAGAAGGEGGGEGRDAGAVLLQETGGRKRSKAALLLFATSTTATTQPTPLTSPAYTVRQEAAISKSELPPQLTSSYRRRYDTAAPSHYRRHWQQIAAAVDEYQARERARVGCGSCRFGCEGSGAVKGFAVRMIC